MAAQLALAGFAAALLGAGAAAGFLGGLLGAGGGLIVIPVLYHTFAGIGIDPAVRMHLVVGTALATVVPMSVMSARAHWRRGNVSLPIVRKLAFPILVGSVLAGVVAGKAGGRELGFAFAFVAALISVNMALKNGFTLGDGLPGPVGSGLMGVTVGALSTLVGIGGGTLTVPLLHAFRTPMPKAVGSASVLGGLIGLPGALSFMFSGLGDPRLPAGSIGFVHLPAAALVFCTSAFAVSWGARFSQHVNERLLRGLFAAFLALTAARMLLAAA